MTLAKMFHNLASPFCLLVLLMILDALGNEWSVIHNKTQLCALKGSTVLMNISYTHPTTVTVTKTYFVIDPAPDKELTDLRDDPGYSGRVEYSKGGNNIFSLRLSDVKKSDEHKYCFRVITNVENEKWLGKPGVTLGVTDLQLIAPAEVTEGESVNLTCETTCSLTDPTFIWYKNTHNLTNSTESNELHLQRVSSEDAGSYNCAVRGSEHLPSPAHNLSVRYSPKNVLVSISPPGEIVEGSSRNLTCSSDSNPPVENYTWYKENEASFVGSGQSYRALQSGLYYCEVQNKVGSGRSAAVSITINAQVSVIVYVAVGLGLLGLAALLSLFIWLRCRRQKNNPDEGDYQNIGLRAKDKTHAAQVSHPSPPDDTLTSDYCNVETIRNMMMKKS